MDVLGHEGVGRVVAIGDGVNPSTVRVGDRVGISWVRDVCGKCPSCLLPDGETRCVQQLNSGRKWDGTFAEYCVVPSRYILLLPDDLGLSDEVIAPILCGGVTAYKALRSFRYSDTSVAYVVSTISKSRSRSASCVLVWP